MASPTLLGRIPEAQFGDVANVATMETSDGAIGPTVTVNIPSSAIVTAPEIYYGASYNNFALQLQIPAAGVVMLSLVPVHPVTLVEFSDLVNGQFVIEISGPIGTATKYYQFGSDTIESQGGLATHAFKLRWEDNVGGAAYNITYTVFGFSMMNRGIGAE
jgi:hypothetical protein